MIPEAEEHNRDSPELIPARMLSEFAYCPRLCYIGLREGDGSRATPVDYKRGEAPDIPESAYEPERVQQRSAIFPSLAGC